MTEQTRAQIERAERVAEEARSRSRAARPVGLEMAGEGDRSAAQLDDDQLRDQGAD